MNTDYVSSASNSSSIRVRVAFDLDMPLAPALIRMFNSLSSHPGFEVFILARSQETLMKAERWGFWVKPQHTHVAEDKQKFCIDNKIDVFIGTHSLWVHHS